MTREVSLGNSPASLFKLLPRLHWAFLIRLYRLFLYLVKGEVATTYARGTFPGQLSSELVRAALKIELGLFHKAVNIIFDFLRKRLL